MAKLRKQRRRKVYRHNVNRKRLRNKLNNKGEIKCKEIKDAWDENKTLQKNLTEMGICYDPNITLKIGVTKKERVAKAKLLHKDNKAWDVEDAMASHEVDVGEVTQSKKHVVEALISDATAPRAKMFRLPKGQVEYLSYMLTKHGNDYKAMAKDKKNYNQETWKQLRGKVKRFQTIPEQYNVFLQKADATVLKKLEHDVQMDDDDI